MSGEKKGKLSLKLGQRRLTVQQSSPKICPKNEHTELRQLCSGLSNLGNTCYCNAVLQALRHCPGFQQELRRMSEVVTVQSDRVGGIAQHLSTLMVEMERSVKTVNPETFVGVLRQCCSQFAGTEQHDAQEMLNFLLVQSSAGGLQTVPQGYKRKASTSSSDVPCKVLKTDMESAIDVNSTRSLTYAGDEPPSISRLFEGKLIFGTRCFECDKCTRRAEAFLHVSVPVSCQGLPGFHTSPHLVPQHTSGCAAPVSLSWALSMFASQERLCGKNKYWCDNCRHLAEAERSVRFSVLPRILTVHLNRFTAHSWGQTVGKVRGNIAVPLALCFRPWCTTDCSYRDTMYRLQAAVLHSGATCQSGHYTAVVRLGNQWLHCDDEIVHELSEKEVEVLLSPQASSACAYILFYCVIR